MLKVILPTSNNWLDKYLNTQEAYSKKDVSKINKQQLELIIKKSIGSVPNYKIEFENRSDGQYFVIENESEIKWILMSADFGKSGKGSTNTYFVEYVPMALRASYEYKTNKQKKVELFLKGTENKRATTEGQVISYRIAKTIGIKILNEEELYKYRENIKERLEKRFDTIEEWQIERTYMKTRNTSNKSSYILDKGDSYIFYGKTFGANGRESIFILCMLGMLAKKEGKKLYLFEVTDNGATALESSMKEDDKRFRRLLEDSGVIYYIDAKDYVENNKKDKLLDEKDKDARHQAEFMKNLMVKFNAKRDEFGNICVNKKGKPIIESTLKKCYLCDCTIQKTIIASHIQRVTDINKLNIPFEEKRKKAVDADNGFWLCANHDKMFEYGIIIFDENDGTLKMDTENLDDKQKNFIIEVTKKMNVSPVHFTNELKGYLKIHNDRLKKVIKNYEYVDVAIDNN